MSLDIRELLADEGRTPDEIAAVIRRGQRDRDRRTAWRDRWRRRGVPETVIRDRLEKMAFDQLVARAGIDIASAIRYANAPDQPDDSKHRPTYVDPVLRGTGRATGETAKAVRRRSTMRRTDHADYRTERM
jgi:hypothetical protein